MQHRGAILAVVKPATVAACCYKNRIAFFARCAGARLAFSKKLRCRDALPNKDPELAAAARRIVEEELQPKPCRLWAGVMSPLTKACWVNRPLLSAPH